MEAHFVGFFKFLRLGKVWPEASALNITRPTGNQLQDWDFLPNVDNFTISWQNFTKMSTKLLIHILFVNNYTHNYTLSNNMATKPGLYANINAKQERIKAGSGEKMRKPGTKGAPTAKQFKESAKTAKK